MDLLDKKKATCIGTLLLYNTATSSSWTDALDDEDNDESLTHRFDGIGRFYAGIDDDWIIYSSVLWSNVLKAWFKVYFYEAINFNIKQIYDWLFPWERSKSDDPWILLELTKSSNFWIRQMGVASLANKADWDSYKYRVVAQACNHRTIVALARYPQANDLYFLRPPKVVPSENSIIDDLQRQVSRLPLPAFLNSKIYYYRHAALDSSVKYQKDPIGMDTLSQFYSIPGEDEKKENKVLHFCLEALLSYTEINSFARLFVENHGLSVLQRLREDQKDEAVKHYVAAILCNLSKDLSLLDDIVSTGWVTILREWSRSSNTALSVLALTVLANLDHDWLFKGVYHDILLLHPTQRNSQQVHIDVVFVHGLRGGAVKTWRQRDKVSGKDCHSDISECWPRDWLAKDCPNTRILSIGYPSALFRWGEQCPYEQDRRTLEGRGRDLIDKLVEAGVGSRPIVWIGHSMGDDDLFRQLQGCFLHSGKGRPKQLPNDIFVCNRLLVQLWMLKEEGKKSWTEVDEWLSKIDTRVPEMARSPTHFWNLISSTAKQFSKVEEKELGEFLAVPVDLDRISPQLSQLG
ncbi:serine active site containing 1, partial [Elysia marginata]